jgi:hypothetical protein
LKKKKELDVSQSDKQQKNDVFTRKKRTFLRVKKKEFFSIKSRVVNSKHCLNHFSLNEKNFLTRKNVRFLRVKTSFFRCLSDWDTEQKNTIAERLSIPILYFNWT